MATPATPTARPTAALVVAVLLTAYLSIAIGTLFDAYALWIPSGVGAYAIARYRLGSSAGVLTSAGVFVAAIGAGLLSDRATDLAVAMGAANTCEAIAIAAVLRARPGEVRGRRPTLDTVEDFLRLLGASGAAGVVGGVGSVLAYRFSGLDTSWADFGTFLASDATGTLTVLPILLARRGAKVFASAEEFAIQVLAFLAVTAMVFAPHQDLSITFLPLLLLTWAGLRFDVLTVALEIAVLTGVATTTTFMGWGPFGTAADRGAAPLTVLMTVCQVYAGVATLLSVPLAMTVQQRHFLMQRLSADEQRFRRNFSQSAMGQVMLRREGPAVVVNDINDAALRMIGVNRDQVVGTRIDQHLLGRSFTNSLHAAITGSRDTHRVRAEVAGAPATRLEGSLSRISSDNEEELYSLQLADVTAEHESYRRLTAAEKLTSATLDTAACVILVTDLDGRIIRVNQATEAITGYTESELVGRLLWNTPITPSSRAEIESLFLWPNRSGSPVVRESQVRDRASSLHQMVWTSNLVYDESGAASYAVITGIDITSERAASGLVTHLMRAPITTALVGVDGSGLITVFNTGAERMLDYDASEQIGRSFLDLFDPDALGGLAVQLDGLADAGEMPPRDTVWVARDGGRRVVSMTLSSFEHVDVAGTRILCVARDVTEQRRSQEALVTALEKERTALERLQALDDAKNEFVSTVSHELRTPITSILGYTEILAEGGAGEPTDGQRRLLDTISRNANRLIDLCNDLLTLSGLDSGAINWVVDEVDLGTELKIAHEAVLPLLKGRDLTFEINAASEAVVVSGDRAQLGRVMLNLLSNAIKFTPDGGEVHVELQTDVDSAVLVVRDTGIGIPAEEQERLFQRFFRSSTAQRNAIQGTGLGLSIVKAIVESHGGTISVRSADGEGSTFTVRLPLSQ